MSGYSVLFRDKGITEKDISLVKEMNLIYKHRGPDSQGYLIDNKVMMGFRGLDTSINEAVEQPFTYQDRYYIVFDGNITNSTGLKEMLAVKGYELNTQSHEELICALYDYMGSAMVSELRGAFSLVLWDNHKEILLAARDPFGIKPLYYSCEDDKLLLTSEMKGLLLERKDLNTINKEALQHYMSFQYVPEPHSMVNGIKVLKQGHLLENKRGTKPTISEYYMVNFNVSRGGLDKKLSEIRSAVEKSVEENMRDTQELACLLSGGIDSTIILALAKEINPKIKSFTVGFDNNGYNEIDRALDTADKLGVENINKIIGPEDFIKELPKIVWHMDQPLADPVAIPLYFASKEAANHVKVLLCGDGADEFFGGYNIYREPHSLRMFSYLPKPLKMILMTLARQLPEGVKGKSFIERGCTPLEDRYIGNANIFKEVEKQALIKDYNGKFTPQLVTKPLYDKISAYDPVSKMQYIDIHTWLSGDILLNTDRMGMAHSVDIRLPFLDADVANIAFQLDVHDKTGNGTTKYALREAFKDIIPQGVLNRKKLGFPVPVRHWLKDELYSWARELFLESKSTGLINTDYAIELLDLHRKGQGDYGRKLWTILIFIIWYQVYIEESQLDLVHKGVESDEISQIYIKNPQISIC
ncbi:MAG: asparagine synthase (glutamine-hydrolyzing) [Tissierellaceae bacterium]